MQDSSARKMQNQNASCTFKQQTHPSTHGVQAERTHRDFGGGLPIFVTLLPPANTRRMVSYADWACLYVLPDLLVQLQSFRK